jgi:hypothetical protein
MSSNRSMEWRYFSQIVASHVEDYTVPQYGDSPHDEVENWTPEMCVAAMQKYTKRYTSGQRGPKETLRDMLKIAHFSCIAYFKLCSSLGFDPAKVSSSLNSNIPLKQPGDYGYVRTE